MVLGALLLVAIGTGLLQQYWMQYGIYEDRPRLYVRWFYLFVLAEVFIILPWAALRGATVWRKMDCDGHLDEYRRTRLPTLSIAAGALFGSLKPIAGFLGVSALVGLAAFLLGGKAEGDAPTAMETLGAHALLLTLAACFAALGQLLAGWIRVPSLALPFCLVVLGVVVGAILCLNPYYGRLADPDHWICGFLVPNPAAAVGTLLKIDVLRFGLVYDHVRAIDYCSLGFRYPPPLFTGVLYMAVGASALAANAAKLRRRGELSAAMRSERTKCDPCLSP